MSLSLDNFMDKILVEPIPSRNWKVSKERWELVYGEREKERNPGCPVSPDGPEGAASTPTVLEAAAGSREGATSWVASGCF